MATDLAAIAKRLPPELRVRASDDGDVERVVEFQNRWATPSHWMSPAAARLMMTANPARAERGKGLALAMKLRALRELRARGVKLFGTTNDEQNAAMRGINRRLGYVPEPPTTMYEKRFS